ncbi:hypothetical protein [Xenorhabdus sp. TH1]|uniref:hypothetical protein n=1 Tax=Xenorhabdus sp. TH1 TaxID=3130166 RepID=UPI0030D0F53A
MKVKVAKTIYLLAAVLLSGCASEPKMFGYRHNVKAVDPVYASGSEAKKYAKAMFLDIDDDGDNYKLYAAYGVTGQQTYRTKLKEPVRITDIKDAKKIEGRNPIDLGQVGLGIAINPVFGLLAFDTRSPEEKMIPIESTIIISHWDKHPSSLQQLIEQRNVEMNPLFYSHLGGILKEISPVYGLNCEHPQVQPYTMGQKSEIDFDSVYKPPFENEKYLTMFIVGDCYLMAYETGEGKYLSKFIDISKELGPTYAMYLPATLNSEPLVLHDGKVMKFRK